VIRGGKKFSRTQLLHFTANQLNVPILAGSSADLPQADNVRVGRDPGTMALALTVSDVKAAVAFYVSKGVSPTGHLGAASLGATSIGKFLGAIMPFT
jgi:hypothetical protein